MRRSFWKTNEQIFVHLPAEAVQPVDACGQDIEILKRSPYALDSVVQNRGESCQETFRWIGLTHAFMDSHSMII